MVSPLPDPPPAKMSGNSPPANPYFRLVAIAGGLFAFTALCMFATALGHPDAPPNHFFNRYGTGLIVIEILALVVLAVLAMAVDGRQTREERQQPTVVATGEIGHDTVSRRDAGPSESPRDA